MISIVFGLLAGAAGQPSVPLERPIINTPGPLTPSPPPATGGASYPARATASLPPLFSTDDYPAEALLNSEQGTVSISAAVDRDGRVTNCTVTTSSGSASLDEATCTIIRTRARFRPARDAKGRRVEDTTSARIRWQLPPARPEPFADRTMAMVLTANAAGEITHCRTEGNAERPADNFWCAPMMKSAKAIAAEARKHVALANRELILESGVLVGGPDAAKGVGHRPGQTLENLVAVAIAIDAGGTVIGCRGADGNMTGERVNKACAGALKIKFVPLASAAANRSERHAVRYSATYTRPLP